MKGTRTMKDMFGRTISEGDVVVFGSRSSSTTLMRVARVISVGARDARLHVVAGNDYRWRSGRTRWDKDAEVVRTETFDGYECTIRASSNVMIANGIDADGIHALAIARQTKRS